MHLTTVARRVFYNYAPYTKLIYPFKFRIYKAICTETIPIIRIFTAHVTLKTNLIDGTKISNLGRKSVALYFA